MTRQRRWQLRKKAAGLCSQCGQVPAADVCPVCRDKHNGFQRARRARGSMRLAQRDAFVAMNGLGL